MDRLCFAKLSLQPNHILAGLFDAQVPMFISAGNRRYRSRWRRRFHVKKFVARLCGPYAHSACTFVSSAHTARLFHCLCVCRPGWPYCRRRGLAAALQPAGIQRPITLTLLRSHFPLDGPKVTCCPQIPNISSSPSYHHHQYCLHLDYRSLRPYYPLTRIALQAKPSLLNTLLINYYPTPTPKVIPS